VTPAQIGEFRKSKYVMDVKDKARESYSRRTVPFLIKSQSINEETYNDLLNVILVEILIDNGHRTGTLLNMTMREYRYKIQDVISVSTHKTSDLSGPARVVLLPGVIDLMDIFVDKVRMCLRLGPAFFADLTKPVFCDYRGNALSRLSNRLHDAWSRSGASGSITATKLRKAAVTDLHVHRPSLRQDAANHMSHSLSVAERSYSRPALHPGEAVRRSRSVVLALSRIRQENA